MRLVMAGVDYTTADMAAREAFALSETDLLRVLRAMPGGEVTGCVLLATCNRTELYISHNTDVPPNGARLLCRALGRREDGLCRLFTERHEGQAAAHLMRVASGLESSVPGDDQIITQVRKAADLARKADAAGPLLEALFRAAVTAGKKVKTRVRFAGETHSVAGQAVSAAENFFGGLAGRRALVIGNGAVGRIAAGELAAKGCSVDVAVRDLSRRLGDLPPGCGGVEFDSRREALAGRDLVVGATSSPRCTILAADVKGKKPPSLFIDLAIPRDIDPAVGELDGVTLWNVDDLRPDGAARDDDGQLALAGAIIAEEAGRFERWRRSRRRHTLKSESGPDFPVFINLHGAVVLIAGGGAVAARRTEKLLGFGAKVRIASPSLSPEMEKLRDRDGWTWLPEPYSPRHLDGATLAIAATDSREANRRIGRDARERGILVSVADKRQECTFYFPAVVRTDGFTAGMISNRGDHAMVKRAAARVRREMEAIDEEHTGGQQGEPAGDRTGQTGHGRDCAASS